ncbi:MAG TPA: glycosyltransferase family 4 protein [Steroidobacteraceae bacterium]|nr:glycosyltransferase family 4 protein [Steroidobacteraceae bacterium]
MVRAKVGPRSGVKLVLEPGGYPGIDGERPPVPALPVASDLPPVMVLADHIGYADGVRHGVTTYLLHVLPLLAAAGIDLTVCFLREQHAAAADLRAHGIRPTFLDAGKWDPTVALRVAALARRRRVRLLHATGVKGTLAARIAARLIRARTLLHVHDLNDPGALLGALQGLVAQPTDAAVCVSQAVRELTVNRYHVRPERVRVARNGVPLEALRSAGAGARSAVRSELGIEPGRPVLAIIGRMHPVKGHRALLSMLPVIVRSCPRTLLLVIGDGPERGPCEQLAQSLGVSPHVRFLGRRADVPRLLSAIDLVLMPSQSEGLGLAAIEALAAARPVIAFAAGGLPEVVADGVSGRLVPPGDCGAFAGAVIDTLREPGRRFAYARGAAISAERFGLGAHVRRLIDCYRMTLAP